MAKFAKLYATSVIKRQFSACRWWSRLDSCALNEPRPIETQEEEKPHSKRNISYITVR